MLKNKDSMNLVLLKLFSDLKLKKKCRRDSKMKLRRQKKQQKTRRKHQRNNSQKKKDQLK